MFGFCQNIIFPFLKLGHAKNRFTIWKITTQLYVRIFLLVIDLYICIIWNQSLVWAGCFFLLVGFFTNGSISTNLLISSITFANLTSPNSLFLSFFLAIQTTASLACGGWVLWTEPWAQCRWNSTTQFSPRHLCSQIRNNQARFDSPTDGEKWIDQNCSRMDRIHCGMAGGGGW